MLKLSLSWDQGGNTTFDSNKFRSQGHPRIKNVSESALKSGSLKNKYSINSQVLFAKCKYKWSSKKHT